VNVSPAPSAVRLRPELLATGYTDEQIRAALRSGDAWHALRPGAYLDEERWGRLDRTERHLLLVRATAPKLGAATVVSHRSAAVLHGLTVWPAPSPNEPVHVTRHRASGGYRKGLVYAHTGFAETTPTAVDGIAVTSVARTIIDCARTMGFDSGVVMADSALRAGAVIREQLADEVADLGRRRGRSQAVAAASFASALSESVGESLSRIALVGLPAPLLQYALVLPEQVVRTDFAWPEFRMVGEFDGAVKYGRLLKDGETTSDVLVRERRRELAIEHAGWRVVRWTWSDLGDPAALRRHVAACFARPLPSGASA
jgi:hypothetical protein